MGCIVDGMNNADGARLAAAVEKGGRPLCGGGLSESLVPAKAKCAPRKIRFHEQIGTTPTVAPMIGGREPTSVEFARVLILSLPSTRRSASKITLMSVLIWERQLLTRLHGHTAQLVPVPPITMTILTTRRPVKRLRTVFARERFLVL
jgi:hypothetical protein